MGSSGKGPAVVRYSMITNEQNSYNIALSAGNFWLACDKLAGIVGLLPKKYDIPIPTIPEIASKQVLQHDETVRIRKWIENTQKAAYAGIQKFIEEEYKKGNLDF